MNFEDFHRSMAEDEPPAGLGRPLEALWRLKKGDWHAAHELAQAQSDDAGAWVHAHLHRVEGDASNAGYWYRRAGKPHAEQPLEQEWEAITRSLLG